MTAALMIASENDHIETVKVLLAVTDIDVNIQDEVRKCVLSTDIMLYDCCVPVVDVIVIVIDVIGR